MVQAEPSQSRMRSVNDGLESPTARVAMHSAVDEVRHDGYLGPLKRPALPVDLLMDLDAGGRSPTLVDLFGAAIPAVWPAGSDVANRNVG
jgi:hypothetical protein